MRVVRDSSPAPFIFVFVCSKPTRNIVQQAAVARAYFHIYARRIGFFLLFFYKKKKKKQMDRKPLKPEPTAEPVGIRTQTICPGRPWSWVSCMGVKNHWLRIWAYEYERNIERVQYDHLIYHTIIRIFSTIFKERFGEKQFCLISKISINQDIQKHLVSH